MSIEEQGWTTSHLQYGVSVKPYRNTSYVHVYAAVCIPGMYQDRDTYIPVSATLLILLMERLLLVKKKIQIWPASS